MILNIKRIVILYFILYFIFNYMKLRENIILYFLLCFFTFNMKFKANIIIIRIYENKFTYLAMDLMYYITYILILIQIQENQLKI